MMEKNKEIQIYMLTHKIPPYGLEDDEYHTPIHCGAAFSDSSVCEVRDDSGDNISEKNPWFLESTGIYWIWKNDDHDYKGQYQYRRRFSLDPEKVPEILKEYDIIVVKPLMIPVRYQYAKCHIVSDLDLCGQIISEMYPDYYEDYKNIIENGTGLYYSNGFITTKEKYDEICEFVFSILFEYEKRMGLKTKDEWIEHGKLKQTSMNSHKGELTDAEYQSRVCGYLFERLFTFIAKKKFSKRYEIPYTLMENMPL